ncbi:hypothetical protein Ddye_014551 [Dipteronia dyeriana]|uniref:MULE transposase domain-containing protein n=1 Tax=Dipteronia dyeriana TaxID=168575 RepID=A0AAD9X8G9_9ROSI|nr:hypothetical protein Ddye_014551 [Dipteronia dyeriana]
MAEQLLNDTNVDASKWQYNRTRSAAREMIQGSVNDQYCRLWEYCAEIKMKNPDSSVIIKCSTAAGGANPSHWVDPNNQMYPVAYAFVESECRETWLWFLELLSVDLELNNSHGIVWIIVKQNGLRNAIREVFPHSEHRFCVKHFYNNYKASHKGLMLKQLLWAIVKSTTKQG